jgi:hypothetical protein
MGNKIFRRKNSDSKSGQTIESNVKKSNDNQIDKNCSICLNQIEIRAKTNTCGHSFCYECIKQWLKKNKNCPLCRMSFDHLVILWKKRNFISGKYSHLIRQNPGILESQQPVTKKLLIISWDVSREIKLQDLDHLNRIRINFREFSINFSSSLTRAQYFDYSESRIQLIYSNRGKNWFRISERK